MSRIGNVVRRIYAEDLKPGTGARTGTPNKTAGPKKNKIKTIRKALGNRRTAIWCVRIVIAVAVLVLVAEAVFQFNRLASWRTVAWARRADVDRELQRRENLIPNVVSLVSRYAAYEQEVFKYVSDARETLKNIRTSRQTGASASNVLEQTLSKLVALAEQYPDLKATQSVQDLIKEAANTENRIADAKEKYNKACEIYNQYISIFPGNAFAFIYRHEVIAYIGLTEKVKVPVIDLNIIQQGGGIEQKPEVGTENANKTQGVKG